MISVGTVIKSAKLKGRKEHIRGGARNSPVQGLRSPTGGG